MGKFAEKSPERKGRWGREKEIGTPDGDYYLGLFRKLVQVRCQQQKEPKRPAWNGNGSQKEGTGFRGRTVQQIKREKGD